MDVPIKKHVNKNFFKKWSPEMAYVLGFFAADGSMIKNNRGGHYIEFHITDLQILKGIKKAVGSNHKISIRKPRKKNWKVSYRLQIGSKQMFKDLMSLGFTQAKTSVLQMPNIPKKYKADFVRGYFDGDGNAYFKRHKRSDSGKLTWVFSTCFTSGHKLFLEQLWSVLRQGEIKGGCLYNKSRGYELVFSRHDSLALYKLM